MDFVRSVDVIYNVLEEYLQEKNNICLYPETVQRKQSKFRKKIHMGVSLLRSWECSESIGKQLLNSALV